jgi:hypothetical protein
VSVFFSFHHTQGSGAEGARRGGSERTNKQSHHSRQKQTFRYTSVATRIVRCDVKSFKAEAETRFFRQEVPQSRQYGKKVKTKHRKFKTALSYPNLSKSILRCIHFFSRESAGASSAGEVLHAYFPFAFIPRTARDRSRTLRPFRRLRKYPHEHSRGACLRYVRRRNAPIRRRAPAFRLGRVRDAPLVGLLRIFL